MIFIVFWGCSLVDVVKMGGFIFYTTTINCGGHSTHDEMGYALSNDEIVVFAQPAMKNGAYSKYD
ncbi:MAG: hypothetical protein K9H64_12640 [Bacteroidales bacterium]|nr:hypothetical protein [Bacteroidales bacterium]MCF8456905.1 hypothetical protein [Bacteroidales bacterium]